MIGGFIGLFTFYFLAGLLVDEDGDKWEVFTGTIWLLFIIGFFVALAP